MKSFDGLATFVAYLEGRIQTIHAAEHRGVEAGAKLIRDEAREEIGHQQPAAGPFPEWDPLSDATVHGFHHPLAGPITGKAERGFSPPDYQPLEGETGELRDSIQYAAQGNQAAVGSNSDKAIWQELGTPNAMFPIPPRSFLGRAAFVKGEQAANGIGKEVFGAIAGRPPRTTTGE